MREKKYTTAVYILIMLVLTCAGVFALTSCDGEKAGGNPDDQAVSGRDSAAEQKQKPDKNRLPRKLRLKYGKKIRLNKKGFVDPDSVYRLKSGTRLTRKEIKKTGGAGRWFRIYKIKRGGRVYRRIDGRSYRANPNVGLGDLRYIKVLYYDFKGKIRVGEIIVNKSIAKDTKAVFRELYNAKYQICRMRLVDYYYKERNSKGSSAGTDADTASMNDDNTSGFNYRMVAGTSTVSKHGYGRAIDVNPFENPWCPSGKLYPNQSRSAEYADRSVRKPHMIFADSKITKIFRKHGFRWLGETGTRDYQHFEK